MELCLHQDKLEQRIELMPHLDPAAFPALSAIVAALAGWLAARYGRKVVVKIADVRIEAPTLKEALVLLDRLQETKLKPHSGPTLAQKS